MGHMAARIRTLGLALAGNSKIVGRVAKLYLLLAAVGGIAFGLSLFAGVSICIIYHVTGLPCPACGMTRAFISLMRLELRQAFAWHPLFFLVPFIPLLALERMPYGGSIPPRLRDGIAWALLGLFILVWVVRMVLFFPHTPPMEYNQSSLFQWLLARFKM